MVDSYCNNMTHLEKLTSKENNQKRKKEESYIDVF